jgi:hypothetical protein
MMSCRLVGKLRYTGSSLGSSPLTESSEKVSMPFQSTAFDPEGATLLSSLLNNWPVRVLRTQTLLRMSQRGGVADR